MPDTTTDHLAGRVSVITGASSGIGAATARALAARGAHVVLAARNADKLNELVTGIREAGGAATARITDVTRPDDVEGLVEFAQAEYGPVDHLVNNAGLMLFSQWADRAADDWNKMIDTNIRGYLNAISAVLPSMIARQSGHILNMSSVAGIRVGRASGVYSATKFFIRGITDSLRQEVGTEHHIQVSMISPGVIDTGWAEKVANEGGKEIARDLNEDAISPDRVADAVLYALDQPADVTVNDLVIHPTRQQW
ncbi:SDR family oxidoreductase [Streptomyces griseoviridis]|uniref:Oxidoreductase n=1 Tax=Streptomyces griseoviridis TaxID=45398 RepID=A0A918L7P5_STRGD|nr:SDR family oxidoreductase [Streptomyces niveoruber]GGS17994.1 oxidoreductase [Streptomyces niveoruber]